MENMKRVLLKLSGEAIKAQSANNYDPDFMDMLVQKIISLTEKGIQVGIVVWWWNLYRWVTWTNIGITRATWDSMWMIGTIMNWLAISDFINQRWWRAIVLSAIEIPRVCDFFRRSSALHHFKEWRVVICVAWTWNPYFSTDSWAVQRALEMECDIVVKATKVDWIYDSDPKINTNAKRYITIPHQKIIEDNLRVMDLTAIAMAKDNKLPMFVCKMEDIEKIADDNMEFWTLVIS